EDIKAPECFYIERRLRERMKIPVFHDDQHGTAIIVGAAILNGLKVVGKDIRAIKLVCSGAGAAALSCLDLLASLGLRRENVWVSDIKGVVYEGRVEEMDENKARYAQRTGARKLGEIMGDADVFLGLSAGGVLSAEMTLGMAPKPLIFALANPVPEILPDVARAARPDAILATGRSDYPNQVNNVLCFPYIFRGALDVGATAITREMEIAAVHAIADLAQLEQSDIVAAAYGKADLVFGPDYLIPKPFDPRLIVRISPAVAQAAMESGVATRPIADWDAYRTQLQQFVYHSGAFMKPLFNQAKSAYESSAEKTRIVFAEGEEERVLRAVQIVVDEGIARPILIGRPAILEQRIKRFGLRFRLQADVAVINPEFDERYRDYWRTYWALTQRRGITEQYAKVEMRRRLTLIGAMMIRKGDADGMICGTFGANALHLNYIDQVIGKRKGVSVYAAMNVLILPDRTVALVDSHINENPTAEELAEITILAAEEMRRLGVQPKVALLSHSNFGTSDSVSALKMRRALALIRHAAPDLEVDGEMHGDCALDATTRRAILSNSTLTGEANLLVMPTIEAANIAYNLLKVAGQSAAVGPILLGAAAPIHILTPTASVRRIVNMTTLAVVDAKGARKQEFPADAA
ncbi:MAG: NADP-dependent malic enzyme, partial [Vicinamibacterales bacterium]|nr:NADP-dependent malic enzyme [Vicinamibacterales bacterium]